METTSVQQSQIQDKPRPCQEADLYYEEKEMLPENVLSSGDLTALAAGAEFLRSKIRSDFCSVRVIGIESLSNELLRSSCVVFKTGFKDFPKGLPRLASKDGLPLGPLFSTEKSCICKLKYRE